MERVGVRRLRDGLSRYILVREGRAEWGCGKPEGARKPSRVKGPSVAEAVVEDRQ